MRIFACALFVLAVAAVAGARLPTRSVYAFTKGNGDACTCTPPPTPAPVDCAVAVADVDAIDPWDRRYVDYANNRYVASYPDHYRTM